MEKLPAVLQRPVGTNWIGPDGHIITYPVRGNRLLNFVGLAENAEWTRVSWSEAGTKEECAADFPGWHPLVHEIIQAVDVPYRWALVGASRWSAGRKGG